MFSYDRMCSLTDVQTDCLSQQNVFSYYGRCSLTIDCVPARVLAQCINSGMPSDVKTDCLNPHCPRPFARRYDDVIWYV